MSVQKRNRRLSGSNDGDTRKWPTLRKRKNRTLFTWKASEKKHSFLMCSPNFPERRLQQRSSFSQEKETYCL